MTQIIDYKKYAILFVDDEEKALKYFSRIFSHDFRIITAASSDEALSIIKDRSSEIGVLISDQRMPIQKGNDLLKFSREKYPNIVRLLTTAYTDINDAIDAVNHGEIFRYITKPWDIENLYDHLKNALNFFMAQYQEKMLLEAKRQAIYQLAGNIAHELRTPLISIHSAAKGTNNYLPQLIDVYKKHKMQFEETPNIRYAHLSSLEESLCNIITESDHALAMIDILLMNINETPIDKNKFQTLSMKDCVLGTLYRFPFRTDQEKMVKHVIDNDFDFIGSSLLITHVFFNLLKNSLYAISANSNRGQITIQLLPGKDINKVSFKDTGSGIPGSSLPHIFDDFYTTKSVDAETNIGIGLPFCKRVLDTFSGNIECFSEAGNYTEFILTFPVITDTPHNKKSNVVNLKRM